MGIGGRMKVLIKNIGIVKFDKNMTYEELSIKNFTNYKDYYCVRVNNEIRHLQHLVSEGEEIEFIKYDHADGQRVYIKTLVFLFIRAAYDISPQSKVRVMHSLNKGLYIELSDIKNISKETLQKLKENMKKRINSNQAIIRRKVPLKEAEKFFLEEGLNEKLELSKYRKAGEINIYDLDGYVDKFFGYLAPNAGYIKLFDIKKYKQGIILLYPRKEYNYNIPPLIRHHKIARVFDEAEKWAEILKINNVVSLNDRIKSNRIAPIIRVSEALQEKKIAQIADEICRDPYRRVVLIAGPSSSGKTTFAKRLGVHLMVNGKNTYSVSLDDYFVNRDKTPKDEFGNYDFEALEAIDTKQFNEDLLKLLEGEAVKIPRFNFVTGSREWTREPIEIDENCILIIEGIHGLNEKLSESISSTMKFKIYISALTQLNVDPHNRIPTTDSRLIRRIVRDNRYRGNNAEKTLSLWASVRRGEERNIFPFQEDSDAMFNSSLVYELAVLSKYAKPLLEDIPNTSIYYSEAKRLLEFIKYFSFIEDEFEIPNSSIIKEFIGGSCFRE